MVCKIICVGVVPWPHDADLRGSIKGGTHVPVQIRYCLLVPISHVVLADGADRLGRCGVVLPWHACISSGGLPRPNHDVRRRVVHHDPSSSRRCVAPQTIPKGDGRVSGTWSTGTFDVEAYRHPCRVTQHAHCPSGGAVVDGRCPCTGYVCTQSGAGPPPCGRWWSCAVVDAVHLPSWFPRGGTRTLWRAIAGCTPAGVEATAVDVTMVKGSRMPSSRARIA